ncbi:MAG: hypothetical protein Q4F21_06870 [Lachnospiraceae bacterium]|nr:hypothetical protein [Lachnospiraceae bacterium]
MTYEKHLKGLYHEQEQKHEHEHGHGGDCGCGHHHEHDHHGHEHDGDCGCGHHHEHDHHEHEHDGDCGCEHHHEHEHHGHEHGEGCGCGHHHGHGNQVMIGRMSGHLLGTMTAYTPASLPVAEVNMNLSMKDVAMFIKENGGVPMQMKASLKDDSTTVIMNMLGSDIYRSESAESTENDASKVKCNLLAVADGMEPEVLREKLEEIMGYFADNAF